MQLNQARFAANGRCGYVLKPACLRHGLDAEPFLGSKSAITLTIEVSGRGGSALGRTQRPLSPGDRRAAPVAAREGRQRCGQPAGRAGGAGRGVRLPQPAHAARL